MTAKKKTTSPRKRASSRSPRTTTPKNDGTVPRPFVPTPPLPAAQHTTLAVRLLAAKLPISGNDIASAVKTVARVWGAVHSIDTEWTIESARCEFSEDQEKGKERWDAWIGRESLRQAADGAAEKRAATEIRRAERAFIGLVWPAPYDEVLRRIMGGKAGYGKEESRHEEFTEAWRAYAQSSFEKSNQSLVSATPTIEELAKRGPGDGGSYEEFDGPAALKADFKEALAGHSLLVENARSLAIDEAQKSFGRKRTDKVSKVSAFKWFAMWKNHTISRIRRETGTRGGKRSGQIRSQTKKP